MNSWVHSLLARLRHLGQRAQLDQDLEDELAAHVALKQRALEREGRPALDAAREARLALGNATAWREQTREAWLFNWLEALWRDIRFAVHLLAKERLFTFVVLLTLTLSIGANTAVFSITNGLLLRLLPVKQPQQLVRLVLTNIPTTGRYWVNGREQRETERAFVSYPLYEVLTRQPGAFSEVFGVAGTGALAVEVNGSPHRPVTARVTGTYFPVLGVQPQAGRLLSSADDLPGGGHRRRRGVFTLCGGTGKLKKSWVVWRRLSACGGTFSLARSRRHDTYTIAQARTHRLTSRAGRKLESPVCWPAAAGWRD